VLSRIREAAAIVLERRKILFALGGEHLVTLPCVEEAHRRHRDLTVVVLDAHLDLRERYGEVGLSHATVSRRILDLVGRDSLAILGARSGTREEFALARELGLRRRGDGSLRDWAAGRPVYLSIDLDVLDPSELPGTGTPEAGGMRWGEVQAILALLRGARLAGMDLTELSPPWTPPAGPPSWRRSSFAR